MPFEKTDIPASEWQFFVDLGKANHRSPNFYRKFNTILVQNGHIDHLGLENNKLVSIPESLGNLTELRALVLYGNNLLKLPSSLAKLSKLEVLSFDQRNGIILPTGAHVLSKNRSRDHHRPIQISAASGYSSSTLSSGMILEYMRCLHFGEEYKGNFTTYLTKPESRFNKMQFYIDS